MNFEELSKNLKLNKEHIDESDLTQLTRWFQQEISHDVEFEEGNIEDIFSHYKALVENCFDSLRPSFKQDLSMSVSELANESVIQYAAEKGFDRIISSLDISPEIVNFKNDNGQTPLHMACLRGHYNTVNALLKKGARSDTKNNQGQTALFSALILPVLYNEKQKQNKESIVRLLIKEYPELIESQDYSGDTILHLIAENGFDQLAEAILAIKPNLHLIENNWNRYPIHTAILNKQKGIIEILFKKKETSEQMDTEKNTALHYAACYGTPKIIQFCIDQSPDIDLQDGNGKTALLLAVEYQNLTSAKALVKNGANQEVKDFAGNNPIHLAVKNHDYNMVKWLVEHSKTDVNAINNQGYTPYMLAKESKVDKDISNLLKEKCETC